MYISDNTYLNLTNRSYLTQTKHLAAFGFPNPKLLSFNTTQSGLPLTPGGHPLYKTQWSMRTRQFLFELNPSYTFISREVGTVYMLGSGKYYQKYTFYLERYMFLSNTLPRPN